MRSNTTISAVLVAMFVVSLAWLGWNVYRIQEAGEGGLPVGSMAEMRLEESVQELVENPSAELAARLLPQARAIHEERGGYRERTLLTIVLYYCANTDPEAFHEYLREALPLLMENYRMPQLPRAGSGELLLNILAMALQEEEFRSWKRDLLTSEPAMTDDLDLLALSLWMETDEQDELQALVDKYLQRELQGSHERRMAFKVNCLLDEFDRASQFEDVINIGGRVPEDDADGETARPALPVADRWTYLSTISFLMHNARFEDAGRYIERHDDELLDPAFAALQQAAIEAALGRRDGEKFRQLLQQASDSPYSQLSPAAAEASVYAQLVESGLGEQWQQAASSLYVGNEDDAQLLCNLAYVAMFSDGMALALQTPEGEQRTTAAEIAEMALAGSRTLVERQYSLVMQCIAAAAAGDAGSSAGFLQQVLAGEGPDGEGFPDAMQVELGSVTQSRFVKALRETDQGYDQAVHEAIREYVARLDAFYGVDPLGLKPE